MTPRTLLVLGSSGFLGRHLARVIAEDADLAARWTVVGDRDLGGARRDVDLCDPPSLRGVIDDSAADVIVNLVGRASGDDAELEAVNVGLPHQLLELVRDEQDRTPRRVVLVGSAAEYGDNGLDVQHESAPLRPTSAYGRSKVRQHEVFRRLAGTTTAVLVRPFNVVGRDMPTRLSLRTFADRIRRLGDGDRLPTGNLSAVRDFLDVDDFARGVLDVAAHGIAGEAYNVSSGRGVVMRDVVDAMIEMSGKQLTVDEDRGADPGVPSSVGSHEKLTSLTGWVPTTDLRASLRGVMETP